MLKMRLIAGIQPGKTVGFTIDGVDLSGYESESIAAALMRAGLIAQRTSPKSGEPRGYYCGMGQCWECAVRVEGQGVVRSCLHPVAQGIKVHSADKDII